MGQLMPFVEEQKIESKQQAVCFVRHVFFTVPVLVVQGKSYNDET